MKRGKRGSIMREIESLLRSGKLPKDVVRMGYSKSTVYEVYKRMKKRADIEVITVFRMLNEGKSIVEIVTEINMDPQKAIKIFEQWVSLKKREMEARRELNEVLIKESDMAFIEIARYLGELKRSQCTYYVEKHGYCSEIDEKRFPIGMEKFFIYDPKRERYYANILDYPFFCAFCGLFEQRFPGITEEKLSSELKSILKPRED